MTSVDLIIDVAVLPFVRIALLASVGFVLSRYRRLDASGLKTTSSLTYLIALPCLVFTKLAGVTSTGNLRKWWTIPVNVVADSFVGAIGGYGVSRATKAPPSMHVIIVAACGLGNLGNLPLVLVTAMCEGSGAEDAFGEDCKDRGLAIAALGTAVAVTIQWTFIYDLMRPPEKATPTLKPSPSSQELVEEND
eukprot:CAMPEP_0170152948 /NCGR_PEP_ID=MMETSP0033_2-20121228/53938_1 /TAXON_ID=195969 /ORGANISM="Dolichomastix tenuilepis, Strain CCMP3274" /LENGTH=191 /DNA_ID=CAMNT_0010390131 /DNA_START=102 /DNA_END=674 /DNA_ORIENTATION=-